MRTLKMVPIAMALLVAACATQTAYGPAPERGGYGYSETKLGDDRYRVTFTGNSMTPRETVQDYALLRAAELTLESDFDWFRLVYRDTDKKSRGGTAYTTGASSTERVYRRCGLISCDTERVRGSGFGGGVTTTRTRDAYSSSIEIVLGKDPMPEEAEAYDAQELASTLRRWSETPK